MALVLNYDPHPGQLAIHNARDRRFRTVCCGRRFGKTLLAAAELIDRGGSEAAGDYGWIAPTYFIAERGVEAVREIGGSFVRIDPDTRHYRPLATPQVTVLPFIQVYETGFADHSIASNSAFTARQFFAVMVSASLRNMANLSASDSLPVAVPSA
jgi:hypothetical protein